VSQPETTLTQFVRDGEVFVPEVTSVGVTERPPIGTLEEYRRRLIGEPS
jgi:hypothetical protein